MIKKNWYWIVGGDQSQAFSSASTALVPSADQTAFAAWVSNGSIPCRVNVPFPESTVANTEPLYVGDHGGSNIADKIHLIEHVVGAGPVGIPAQQ